MARTRQQEWRKTHPERYLAHLWVQTARKLGLLTPQPCEECGSPKSEAHHDDYSRPGEVRWLCRRHHRIHHANEAKG